MKEGGEKRGGRRRKVRGKEGKKWCFLYNDLIFGRVEEREKGERGGGEGEGK